MGYRGEDLDLRTPQAWSGAQTDPAAVASGEGPGSHLRSRHGFPAVDRNGPIWVDETVLLCCNHAFDVALAHRAGEVRLEHLVLAMTRNDAAAEALEMRGVRVMGLRRELGSIVASDIPVGLPSGKGTPRRSDELENVLRIASAYGARRDATATVDDLTAALFDSMADVPVLMQFTRLGPQRTPGSYAYDASERSRAYSSMEPQRGARAEAALSTTDNTQSSRIDALEQTVRVLLGDLQSERKMFTGALQDLQRELMAQRDDTTPRYTGGSHDRLQQLEQAALGMRGAPADLGPVIDRIALLERSIMSRPLPAVDLMPITNRLDIIEEAVLAREPGGTGDLATRILALETQLAQDRERNAKAQAALSADIMALTSAINNLKGEIAVAVLTPMTQRIDGLVASIESGSEEGAAKLGVIGDRVAQIAQKTEESQASFVQELGEVHEALMKLNANQHTLADSVDQWRRDDAASIGGLGTRVQGLANSLAGLERESGKSIPMIEQLTATVDRMHKVTVEKYYRRNRFWYWLFGTDDWVAASWPSQSARIVEDLKAVKGAPKS